MTERTDLPAELRGALTGDMRRDRERRELSLRLPRLRGRDRPGHRHLARSCGTPPSTTSARAVNPLIIHGQTHGGIAQGIGQALLEHASTTPAPGSCSSGSFMDYAMPRAARAAVVHHRDQRGALDHASARVSVRPARAARRRRSGVVVNAIVDALAEFGVEHIEMPVTSERIWRAMYKMPPLSRMKPERVEDENYGVQ